MFNIKKINKGLIILTIINCSLVLIRALLLKKIHYLYLIWNLFLALIPYLLALSIDNDFRYFYKTKKLELKTHLKILSWFFILPNSFYMITDLIHIRAMGNLYKYINYNSNLIARNIPFDSNLIAWYDFYMSFSFVLLACIFAFFSLKIISNILFRAFKKQSLKKARYIAHSFNLIILLINSYAIYLGRFIRFNSWDVILNPTILFNIVSSNINMHMYSYSILTFFHITLCYYTLDLISYNFIPKYNSKNKIHNKKNK
ncbi:MAG: DUF1361 domain-containing protein [Peptostreptococcaceae bacterium]|jgi:uncharacterized membrane protein|nr:DUF1361 domain-containing protein [Peptostreptococcaceae bacterium]